MYCCLNLNELCRYRRSEVSIDHAQNYRYESDIPIDMRSMVAFINDRGKFSTLKKQRFVHIKPLHKSTGKSEQIFALAKLLVKTKISPIQRQQHRHPHWQHVKQQQRVFDVSVAVAVAAATTCAQ